MKKILALTLLTLLLLSFGSARSALAAPEVQKQLLPTSPLYLLVRAKESIQQLLTFNQSSKAKLLEGFAEQRIKEMDYASFTNDDDALSLSLDRYQAQKAQALEYVKGASDSQVVDQIKEGGLEQQKAMTKMQLQTKVSEDTAQRIVEVQKDVVEKTKNTVTIVQSIEEAIKMEEEVHYIWLDPNVDTSDKSPSLPDEIDKWEYSPGTAGRDDDDRIVEFNRAPGTEGQGEGGSSEKIKLEWAPATEGKGESGVKYENAPKVVNQGTVGEERTTLP